MKQYWLITYESQTRTGPLRANSAINTSPAAWLAKEASESKTVFLFAMPITEDEYRLLDETL